MENCQQKIRKGNPNMMKCNNLLYVNGNISFLKNGIMTEDQKKKKKDFLLLNQVLIHKGQRGQPTGKGTLPCHLRTNQRGAQPQGRVQYMLLVIERGGAGLAERGMCVR